LRYTKGTVVIYVADSIHAINIEVRNDKSPESALKKALKMGDEILDQVKKTLDQRFTEEQRSEIIYAHWTDLLTESYIKKRDCLYSIYKANPKFRDSIHMIIKGYVSREHRAFSESEVHKLGTYLIEEMPELMLRVPIKGIPYDAYAYPFDGGIAELAEDIQKGIRFPEIKERIMDAEPKVFLEVR
jgi:DNA-directed RNA polymerase subunit L